MSDRSLALARTAVFATVVIWLAFAVITVGRIISNGDAVFAGEALSYLLIVTLLAASALAYLASRVGFMYRARQHRRVPRETIDRFYESERPTLTVLVPAFREDARVVRKTLLSAALQEYPGTRIVLLIDDPPDSAESSHQEMLEAARALPAEVAEVLSEPAAAAAEALQRFEGEIATEPVLTLESMRSLASNYDQAVQWLRDFAEAHEVVDHADRFFAGRNLADLADDLELVSRAVTAAADAGVVLPTERTLQLYRRLAWTFQAELTSFERKQFASLSNEPNKAMNLNSYIGLMGGTFADDATNAGRVLWPVAPGEGAFEVPNADYVLTLDADSMLLPEYCLRLIYLLEQPENARVAVAQTPYSAFPGAGTRLERIAGATTDLQHLIHQGLTYYDATFWVGANAVLRKTALDDIVKRERVGSGWEIARFIQDRTVIEDTESTIDLGLRGWTLFNYPERLSYSATPPDFGSLCIQRQRWADGGLLILAKMWRHASERREQGERARLSETFLRVNYMASIAWANLSLLLLLALPYNQSLLSPLVFAAALPYFLAMSSDLKYCGYKRLDVLRIYGFNLILLPVNLAGALKSVGQGITGQKIAFARTPKIRNRTTAPVLFALAPYLLVGLAAFTAVRYVHRELWDNATFAGLNALLAAYAILAFIGLRNSLLDIGVGIVNFFYRPVSPADPAEQPAFGGADARPRLDWATVLHYGTTTPPPRSLPPALSMRETPRAPTTSETSDRPDLSAPAGDLAIEHGSVGG